MLRSLAIAAAMLTTQTATEPFEFHSGFWINLHHFVHIVARGQAGKDLNRPTVIAALADTTGLGRLEPNVRDGWTRALAIYSTTYATRELLFDSGMVAIKNRLSALENAPMLRGSGLDSTLIEALETAAPAYRALWWPRHDAANARWVRELQPLLVRHGDAMMTGIARAFRMDWPSDRMRVDVVAYANWAGAYTTEEPSHVTISSLDENGRGADALETMFHEPLHTMEDSVTVALRREGQAQGKRGAGPLAHALIFYTAGALTSRAIPGHLPYAERTGIWSRIAAYQRVLPAMKREWQDYLDGRASFEVAIKAIVAAI
jgi:hypothetical protein